VIRPRLVSAAALALAASLALSACFGAGSRNEPIRYWVLSALPGPPGASGERRTLAVGPVEIPDHLNRAGIVVRDGRNRLQVASLDQWGEPLVRGIQRVIAENLAVLSPQLETVTFPWWSPGEPDLQLSLAITRLDARPGREVELMANWVITHPADRSVLATGSTWLSEPVAEDDIEDVVAATSRLMERWSRELLAAIQALSSDGGNAPGS